MLPHACKKCARRTSAEHLSKTVLVAAGSAVSVCACRISRGRYEQQTASNVAHGMRHSTVTRVARTIYGTYGVYIGLARTIYIRCTYGIFGREITEYTVIYGVYIQVWPTLCISGILGREITKHTVMYDVYIWSWPT